MRSPLTLGALCCAVAAAGSTAACSDALGEQIEISLSASGAAEASFESGLWQVTLDSAEIGFGPLYLCPAEVPTGELCATALAELGQVVTIDVLNAGPAELPSLVGTTGTVRSAVFDYGISWPLTFGAPRPGDGAPGGRSARFTGTAVDGARTLHFSADVDVVPNAVERLASGSPTAHTLRDASSHLHLVFDPVRWWRAVDFDALAAQAASDPPDAEATQTIHLEPAGAAYGSIVHEMSAGARPRFEWSRSVP